MYHSGTTMDDRSRMARDARPDQGYDGVDERVRLDISVAGLDDGVAWLDDGGMGMNDGGLMVYCGILRGRYCQLDEGEQYYLWMKISRISINFCVLF